MSRKRAVIKGHRRCSSIGTTLERVLLNQQAPMEKAKSTSSTYETGFEREQGLEMLVGTILRSHGMRPEDGGMREEDGVMRAEDGGMRAEDTRGGSSRKSSPDTTPLQLTSEDKESPAADSASNVSTDQVQENITKLRDDYANLLREVESLRETYRDSLTQITSSIEKQREYFVAALQDTTLRIRQIDDRVDDKLDQFHYSSDERVKDIEERLDNYKYKMTRFEELQEQRRMENPLTGTDIASRGRDVMSSVISLGLAMVSLVLFVFTTVVDCLKVFSENNALSTCLSLGLFGVIIAFYYYFEVGRTT